MILPFKTSKIHSKVIHNEFVIEGGVGGFHSSLTLIFCLGLLPYFYCYVLYSIIITSCCL